MANKQSFRNFSEMEQPGVPMASYFRRRVHSINADFTISNPLAFTPQPTAFSFSDISPKPYFAGNLDVNSIPSRDIIGTSAAAKFSFRARGNENALAV
jgi:hypothetical protein